MKLAELKAGQGKVDIMVTVTAKGDPRSFDKYGKQLRVCNATVSDGESDMTLSLWNDEIDTVSVGAQLQIANGYVSEFQGKKQLSAGKFGKLSVVGAEDADAAATPAKSAKPAKAKPAPASSEDEMAF
ncbi:DNA-binding protein [Candidatus Pacearchaeota archaeon]|nr:DNA-binding protein [Candidatus Pacearchaeota archaeon]